MIQTIAAVVGSAIMIFLTISLISQWRRSSKTSRAFFSDLVIQWFFWLTIVLLIVVSL